MEDLSREISELARRRGFYFQTAEVYGGESGFYTYGPRGAPLKQKVESEWRDLFKRQEGHMEIDSPTVMPEAVFEASGHLEGFDDMIVVCGECGSSHRADHLVEDSAGLEEAESLPPGEIMELIDEHGISCPDCGSYLAGEEVEEFNLMFETSIGPGSSNPGYLRPETAQGIFVDFNRLKEYARGQLPFGVTQVGKAYRNEISPRKGLVRVREFTQAELELFIDPEENSPGLEEVEDTELPLYPRKRQGSGDGTMQMTAGEAVEKGVISSGWIAYYLALSKKWYESLGVDMERFRFRQHQEDELSHYASDTWDAESRVNGDWIEMAGFAYRGCYDLESHQESSGEEFTVFRQYDQPRTVERATVNPDMDYLGPELGDDAEAAVDALEEKAEDSPDAFEKGSVTVEVDGSEHEIPVDKTGFSRTEIEENGEHITPAVVEPSFGIDRIVYTLLAHSLEEDKVAGEERTVLRLEPGVAPVEVGVFPLMDKDGMGEKARELAESLRSAGFSVAYDDSGAIGRRYRRQDEIGTPFCVTVDHDTLEDGTVTVRDRDSTEQVRVDSDSLEEALRQLLEGADLEEV